MQPPFSFHLHRSMSLYANQPLPGSGAQRTTGNGTRQKEKGGQWEDWNEQGELQLGVWAQCAAQSC